MGKRQFKKPEEPSIQGTCVRCHKNPQRKATKTTYKPICGKCDRELRPQVLPKKKYLGDKRKGYQRHKTDKCEECGFKAFHPCQLDVDHMDGDHTNNSPDNLWTLCANCHRLKTVLLECWNKRERGIIHRLYMANRALMKK